MPGSQGEHGRRLADIANERCAKTASLYVRGKTFGEIAEELGISRDTVKNDMKRARAIWRKRASRTYAKHLHEQLAKLDEVENAAWVGWERSLKDELDTGTEDTETPRGAVSKTKIRRRSQCGNASMLKTISEAVRQRSELLGLLDSDARNGSQDEVDAEVVSIVIESREEAHELKSLSLADYREKIASAG